MTIAHVLIAALGTAAVATIVWAVRNDALLAPLGIIALTVLLYFVVRPLELLLSSDTLLRSSYDPYATAAEALTQLSAQEISLYVQSRMVGTLDGALGRAMLVLALFFAAVLAGHRLRAARRLARTWSRLGAGTRALDMRWVIAAWLAIGLAAQALIFASIGGLAGALANFSTYANLQFDFVLLVALNFYTAGLVLWVCWHPPLVRRDRVLLGAAVGELAGFYLLLGSRTLVIVPLLVVAIALHELVRPWRPRALLLAMAGAIVFSSAYLSLREGARETARQRGDRRRARAGRQGPRDPRHEPGLRPAADRDESDPGRVAVSLRRRAHAGGRVAGAERPVPRPARVQRHELSQARLGRALPRRPADRRRRRLLPRLRLRRGAARRVAARRARARADRAARRRRRTRTAAPCAWRCSCSACC